MPNSEQRLADAAERIADALEHFKARDLAVHGPLPVAQPVEEPPAPAPAPVPAEPVAVPAEVQPVLQEAGLMEKPNAE